MGTYYILWFSCGLGVVIRNQKRVVLLSATLHIPVGLLAIKQGVSCALECCKRSFAVASDCLGAVSVLNQKGPVFKRMLVDEVKRLVNFPLFRGFFSCKKRLMPLPTCYQRLL